MPTIQIERRHRGFFGWIIAILFWGWQLLMVVWLFRVLNRASQYTAGLHNQAEITGAALGTGVGTTMIAVIWVLGTVIFGFMMMFTRGRRELITVERT